MRMLLIAAVLLAALVPGRPAFVRPSAPSAPALVDDAGLPAAPDADASRPQLPEEETQEDGDPAVLLDLPDHHGQRSVPHFHEYLMLQDSVLGYPPLIPPDGARA
jgi:hypothetical protein